MALKAGRRPRVGELAGMGEVKPVTTRHLLMLSLGVLLLVVAATTAILIASSGTKKSRTTDTNVPRGTHSSSSQATLTPTPTATP
jgi:hypothetical protein